MGIMTVDEMQDALRWDLDNRSTSAITQAQLLRWLNWTYYHISQPRIYRHVELMTEEPITLVLDTIAYPLTTTALSGKVCVGTYNLTYYDATTVTTTGNRFPVKGPDSVRFFDLQHQLPTGRPTRYARYGNQLELNRRPGANEAGNVMRLRFWQLPSPLVAGATTVVNQLWDEVLIAGGKWRGWKALNRPDRSELARDEFGAMINEVRSVLEVDQEDYGGRGLQPRYVPYQSLRS